MESGGMPEEIHLVVLLHGIDSPLGSAEDMGHIEQELDRLRASTAAGQGLRVLRSVRNTGRTQDGLLCLGRRLLEEMEEYLVSIAPSPASSSSPELAAPIRLSFVGHSLGGLIARSCVGWIERRGLFASGRYLPVSYLSVATPHLGARRGGKHNRLLRQVVQFYFFGPTLHELFLEDHLSAELSLLGLGQRVVRLAGPQQHPEDGAFLEELRGGARSVPLLWLLCEPDSVFVRGLRRFAFRTLVSPVQFDWQVPYCSSAISATNPHAVAPCTPSHNRIALLDGFPYSHAAHILSLAHPVLSPTLLKAVASPQLPQVPASQFRLAELATSRDFTMHQGLYHPTMLGWLLGLSWRRLDISLDRFFAHDLLVAKQSVPGYDVSIGLLTSALFASICFQDHLLFHSQHMSIHSQRPQQSTPSRL